MLLTRTLTAAVALMLFLAALFFMSRLWWSVFLLPGLLLAGDAAGFVDPMTGDGLRFAFRGAELAALEALHALEYGNDDAHVRLSSARQRAFSAKWRFNRTMRWMVAAPRTLRIAEIGAGVAPFMLQRVIRYAGDLNAA